MAFCHPSSNYGEARFLALCYAASLTDPSVCDTVFGQLAISVATTITHNPIDKCLPPFCHVRCSGCCSHPKMRVLADACQDPGLTSLFASTEGSNKGDVYRRLAAQVRGLYYRSAMPTYNFTLVDNIPS